MKNPILRNILAVLAGIVVGAMVNMGLVELGQALLPVPGYENIAADDMASFKAMMQDMEPKHYLFPFLAHALGTFCGALVTYTIAVSKKRLFALCIGAWFLLGGLAMVAAYGGAVWFVTLDLLVAYLPMAFLATIVKK